MQPYLKFVSRKKDVDFASASLVVIDMQKYFQNLTPQIIGNVNSLITKFRQINRPIIFTQYHDDPNDHMMSEWWPNEEIEKNKSSFHFVSDLQIFKEDFVLAKTTYDSFYKTDFDNHLRQHNTTDLIIVGVLTNCCCETTARAAFVRNYRVHFVPDANATYDEALQQSSLTNLAYAFAYMPLTEALL